MNEIPQEYAEALLEAKNIAKYATLKQKKLLKSERHLFDPLNDSRCIYGLMYGNSFAIEAIIMMNKCMKLQGTLSNYLGYTPLEKATLDNKDLGQQLIDIILNEENHD